MLNDGQILQGNYRIVGSLGHGGMGSVYLAEHTRLGGRKFAIKESVPEANADPQTLADLRNQFYVEAKTLAALDHPNLPKVSDYFAIGDNEYLVMDLVEGEDLQQVLDHHVQQFHMPLPETAVLGWAYQVLNALEYMHGQRPAPIIHRDIKPGNIILTPTGVVKLVDFGLVKLLDHDGQGTSAALRGMGTPAYTALEQYPGNESHTDARTDLYGLGATMYHLLTGVPPANVRDRLLNPKTLDKPRNLNPKLSTRTEAAILKAIEVHPDQRFQSADEMSGALGAAKVGQSTVPTSKRSWIAPVAILAAVLLLAGGALAWAQFNPPESPKPTLWSATIVVGATATYTPTLATLTSTKEPTVQPVVTDTPTSMPTEVTPTPTSTIAPTDTPSPTATETPTVPKVVASSETSLYAGPGTAYAAVGSLPAESEAKITGKNQDGTWWELEGADGASVWIIANRVEATGAVNTVEVVPAPPTPTASPTPTPPRPGLVADFEQGPVWPTGEQKYGQFALSREQVRVGTSAAQLSYDFPAVIDNFVVFLAPSPIAIWAQSGQPTGLVAWVYGNGSGHFLNAWVQDRAGEVRSYTFGRVLHNGWQQMTAWFDDTQDWPNGHISGTEDNGVLDYPVSLYALVLDGVPDGEASSGAITLDEILSTDEPIPVGRPAASQVSTSQNAQASTPVTPPSALGGTILYTQGDSQTNVIAVDVANGNTWVVAGNARQADIGADSLIIADGTGAGRNNLFTVRRDGSGERVVGLHTEDSYPHWSPSRLSIVFYSTLQGDGRERIYIQWDVTRPFEPEVLQVGAQDIYGRTPIWMGNWRIAFSGCDFWSSGSLCGIWTVDSDGKGNPVRVTDRVDDVSTDSWRSQLLYSSRASGNWEVLSVSGTGGSTENLTNSPSQDLGATFSPDGNYIAFMSNRDGGWGIWIMNADGSDPRKLLSVPSGFGSDLSTARLSWGP
ncbi:MAG: protein kinase [Anaerolineae bacterium]|nr:protein kinase [Anaerolineae bacterium]